jgi:hypothetical protein
MIQIDRGIPLPPRPPLGRPKGHPGKRRYPWTKLGVGDSFVFPGTKLGAWQRIGDRRRFDRRQYEARQLVENGQMVVRIWRVV